MSKVDDLSKIDESIDRIDDLIKEVERLRRKAENKMRVQDVILDADARGWLEFLLTGLLLMSKLKPIDAGDVKAARKSAGVILKEFENDQVRETPAQ